MNSNHLAFMKCAEEKRSREIIEEVASAKQNLSLLDLYEVEKKRPSEAKVSKLNKEFLPRNFFLLF